MKHEFLLDIMVLLFAIKEENAAEERDATCANLVQLIGQNCHRIHVDKTMRGKYLGRLGDLSREPRYQTPVALFLTDFIYNSAKFGVEASEPPEIPASAVDGIPKEDHYVVRAALISHPIIVTDEEKLRNRINAHGSDLGLRAISPAEALELAKDS